MIERVRLSSQCSIFDPSPVLITESAEEFERFHDALQDELKARGLLERFYVADIAEKAWESRRLRRVKIHLISSAFRSGLKQLLDELIDPPEQVYSSRWRQEIAQFADKWFSNKKDKKEVLEVLERFGLDPFAVEAAAVRSVATEIETIDRLMASQEARLSRSVRWLADLRGGLGRQLHAKVERVIEGRTLALEGASKQPPPEQA
jgi:hypothetical protein